jgi:hypothetical protein
MLKIRTLTTVVLAAAAVALTSLASFAASQFEGKWKVTDSGGKPFEVTLASDGSAKADRGEGMSGTWKEDSGAAVITWDTGWTTKISKDGDKYTKSAFKKGEATDGKPANTSAAEKVK